MPKLNGVHICFIFAAIAFGLPPLRSVWLATAASPGAAESGELSWSILLSIHADDGFEECEYFAGYAITGHRGE